MKRRCEIHIGRRQSRHIAHEAARRQRRKQLARIELLWGLLIPSRRMLDKRTARKTMLEAIAEERKAERIAAVGGVVRRGLIERLAA